MIMGGCKNMWTAKSYAALPHMYRLRLEIWIVLEFKEQK